MAEHRQWLRDTQLEPGTGGHFYDLAHEQGDTADSVSNGNDTESFVEVLRWQRADVAGLEDPTVPTSVNITDLSDDLLWDPEVRWRLQRLDNTGTAQESSAYSPVVGATGIHTADLTLDTRWNPGDLFALSLEARRNGGVSGTVTVTVATQDADSFADATILREPKGGIRRPTPPVKRFPVEARFWVRTRAIVTAHVADESTVAVDLDVDARQHAYPRAQADAQAHVEAATTPTVIARSVVDAAPQLGCDGAAHAPVRLAADTSAETSTQVRHESATHVETRSDAKGAAHAATSVTTEVRAASTAALDDIDGLLAALT